MSIFETSFIETCINKVKNFNEPKNCEDCGESYVLKNVKLKGNYYNFYAPNCECIKKKQQLEYQKEIRNNEKEVRKLMLERYNFLIDYRNRYEKVENMLKNLDENQLKVATFLSKYREDYINGVKSNIYLYGTSGTGKTSFIKRLSKTLEENDIYNYIVDVQKLLSYYKNTYQSEALANYQTEYAIDNIMLSNSLIILDDVGTEKPSEWTVSKLMFIINSRIEENKPTIITTNYSPTELVDRFVQAVDRVEAQRLVGRMVLDSKVIELNTKDYRFNFTEGL